METSDAAEGNATAGVRILNNDRMNFRAELIFIWPALLDDVSGTIARFLGLGLIHSKSMTMTIFEWVVVYTGNILCVLALR